MTWIKPSNGDKIMPISAQVSSYRHQVHQLHLRLRLRLRPLHHPTRYPQTLPALPQTLPAFPQTLPAPRYLLPHRRSRPRPPLKPHLRPLPLWPRPLSLMSSLPMPLLNLCHRPLVKSHHLLLPPLKLQHQLQKLSQRRAMALR